MFRHVAQKMLINLLLNNEKHIKKIDVFLCAQHKKLLNALSKLFAYKLVEE